MKILIVDDHQAVRTAVRSLLSSHSEWTICGEAVDGIDAVEKARSLHPNIILMDISMPRMDGVEATRIIRHEVPEADVIIVSQNDSKLVSRQAAAVGAQGFVPKAELARTLVPLISSIFNGHKDDSEPLAPALNEIVRGSEQDPQRFRQALDELPAAVYITDAEGRLTYYNAAAIQFSGRIPELGTDSWCVTWKLFRPDGTPLPHDQCPMAVALKQGRPVYGEEAIAERPDGTRRWFTPYPRPLRNGEGQIVGGINMLVDITDRKHLQSGSNLLAAIVNSSDDAIVSKNLSGIVTSWNAGAERMFGYTAQEVIGKSITLIIPPERLGEETEILSRIRRGERIDHFDTVRRRKDGTLIDVAVTISPLCDAQGRIIGASKIARDVTERKRAHAALLRSEEQFRALSESLDTEVQIRTLQLEERSNDLMKQAEQVRDLSHRLLQTEDEERRHIARELHDSAGQTLTVLSMNLAQLLQTAKACAPELASQIEASEHVVQQLHREIRTTSYLLHPPLLDESGLASALAWYIEGLTERTSLKIDLEIPDDFGRIPQDMELGIFRVVQESLTNIHRHSGATQAVIRIACANGSFVLEVADNGKGMPPDKLAEVQTRGTGVGIRGMRERVHQFHGEMTIDSDPSGTRIRVRIPVPAVTSKTSTQPFPATPHPTPALLS